MTRIPDRLHTKEQVAALLGEKVSYIEYLARSRKLGHYRSSGLRFSDQHIADYLAACERRPEPGRKAEVSAPGDAAVPAPSPRPHLTSLPTMPQGVQPLQSRPERARSYRKPA